MSSPEMRSNSPELPRRVIGRIRGEEPGPTVICVGAMHGNEPAGYRALERVCQALRGDNPPLKGEFLALLGNRRAFLAGLRFLSSDLNRHFSAQRIEASRQGLLGSSSVPEDVELDELRIAMSSAFQRARGRVHVMDLHTTSGSSPAFALVADTLLNRSFGLQFPSPLILGLEEELEGTLTEYVEELGHVAIGFEGGQHDDPLSTDRCEAAIWIALASSGQVDAADFPQVERSRELLESCRRGFPEVLEVRYRHAIDEQDEFRMEPGFQSFQRIEKGQLLATDRDGEIRAGERGRVLMPLYQKQGEDGFFIMREFKPIWLTISASLRRLGLESIIHWLPGVERHPELSEALSIDRRVARWYSLQLFHLLGYRRHRSSGNRLVVERRKHDSSL
ncbi:MAG: succinylglutamate desuccinylase/aspartoacylase family protein [Acidobacteriota bacterium]